MSEQTPALEVPVHAPASDAARKARRLVYMALEERYDDAAKRYRPGHSDATIAKELGVSVESVKATRESDFGPLGVPPELESMMGELASAARDLEALRAATVAGQERVAASIDKLHRLALANGWAI